MMKRLPPESPARGVLSDNETPLFVVFPEVGVLLVASANDVGSTEGLIGNRQMSVERCSDVVTCDENARRTVPRGHDAESPSLQIE